MIQSERRVCIIGAGAAGLAAARALRRKGYAQITLLERAPEPGGKCVTTFVDGRACDRGAILLNFGYQSLRPWLAEAGLSPGPVGPKFTVTGPAGGAPVSLESHATRKQMEALPRELLAKLDRVRTADFRDLLEEGSLPLGEWVRQGGYGWLWELAGPQFTACGYGYREEPIPAAYFLRHLTIWPYPRMGGAWLPFIPLGVPDGFQTLFRRTAEGFRVLLGSAPTAVRRGERVEVSWPGGAETFDDLILACPLDEALRFLDASPEERNLLSRIRYLGYASILFEPEAPLALAHGRSAILGGHLGREAIGRTLMVAQIYPDRPVHVAYLRLEPGTDPLRLEAHLREDLAALGGRLKAVHRTEAWRYLPHVSPLEFGPFYLALEGLQGARRTYFAGELMAGSLVELVAAYSERLVERFF